MTDLVLYHYYRSTCSWRVRWALNYKQLNYKLIPVNLLKDEQNSESYQIMNPISFVPTLKINEEYYGDSIAILEWLDEYYPQPSLLPQDPQSRLRVRQLSQIISSSTQPLQNFSAQRYYSNDKEEQIKYANFWIKRGLNAYEKILNHTMGTYSFGESLTLADICLVPQCYNAIRFHVNLNEYPSINQVYHECIKLDHYKRSHPDNYK